MENTKKYFIFQILILLLGTIISGVIYGLLGPFSVIVWYIVAFLMLMTCVRFKIALKTKTYTFVLVFINIANLLYFYFCKSNHEQHQI